MSKPGTAVVDGSRFIPDHYVGTLEPNFYCRGWNAKREKYCGARAGRGTDHKGVGRCKNHGGANPVKHRRYSKIEAPKIRELIDELEADPDPLNVLPDLATARALFVDFVNRYHENREMFLAWWAVYSPAARPISPQTAGALRAVVDELEALIGPIPDEPGEGEEPATFADVRAARAIIEALEAEPLTRPKQYIDLSSAIGYIDVISKIVDRIEKNRSANAISRPELMRVMAEMGRAVAANVPDVETRRAIERDWLRIHVNQ